jgi:type II secretory pathway pseudopilin PulG
MIRKAPYFSAPTKSRAGSSERGAALVTAMLILGMLSAIAITVLAVVSNEAKIAGSDLKRTQTFYAAAAGIEKMTTDFSAVFQTTSRPTATQLFGIQNAWPQELQAEGYNFDQLIGLDVNALNSMRATQGITNGSYPRVTIPGGPFNGLSASVAPYVLNSRAFSADGTEVALTRQMNNYLIPIFQFGMFSNDDIELHPGPPFSFNGRVHANGNIYVNGNVSFLAKVTTANELVYDVLRNGVVRTGANVSVQVGAARVPLTEGSMFGGPNIVGATAGQRGFFPDAPDGTINSSWDSNSVSLFAGQVQTRSTGGTALLLPMQLSGNSTREIIKRRTPADPQVVRDSRYHSKAQIRILIDDENPAAPDVSGIPAGQGLPLTAFDPIPLPNVALAAGGGRALWRIRDDGTYQDNAATCVLQEQAGAPGQALTVRGVKAATQAVSLNGTATNIPAGAGLSGRILVQIVDPNGNVFDVTQQILSMGITVGEPNAIVTLQRPLWAAFTQGSRDASALQNIAPDGTPYYNSLTDIVGTTYIAADGQIQTAPGPVQDGTYGYLTGLVDNVAAGPSQRADTAPALNIADWGTANWSNNQEWNAIIPINVYNVREGCIDAVNCNAVYERGITNVVELNMKNLARWLDGVYDNNLLAGTQAVSANIANPGGFTVYVSDRRGDQVKPMTDLAGNPVNSSNGMVDNEDIYGPNDLLEPGEDVQNTGALVKDTAELPDPAVLAGIYGADLTMQALTVAAWTNPNNYFRHAVRLFNGEDLQLAGGATQLSATQGITMSTENMIYIWGNYNTTGINLAPPLGTASLNDPAAIFNYLGDQVPASIVADAFFPLSKTWADSCDAMYPGNLGRRPADLNVPSNSAETAVRAGIIAGNNLGALAGNPDAGNTAGGESRLNGGMHNFPRFLERWGARWNFVGSLIPLYHSTQALGQYNANSTIYSPPIRNWAFDTTFLDPNRLPPSTPQFQYVQPTAFRQLL